MSAWRDARGTREGDRGSIRHRTNDAHTGSEPRFDRTDGDAGGDGDDERACRNALADMQQHAVDDLTLEGENDQVGLGHVRLVVVAADDAVLQRELLEALATHVTRAHLFRSHGTRGEEAANECAGHVAGAEHADFARVHSRGVYHTKK